MSPEKGAKPHAEDSGFSPVDNELPLRLFRRLRLAPARGLGAGRRALLFAALTWLPIVTWAAIAKHLVDTDAGEPLLRHFGVHVRCLIAIPLFIFAETGLHRTAKLMVTQFLTGGAVPPSQRAAFERSLSDVRRLGSSSLPWVFVLGATLAALFLEPPHVDEDAYSWAISSSGALGFGGWWYAYVARPVFVGLLLGWLWRMALMTYWFWRVARLDLSLVPSHPDRSGGLSFVEKLPVAFAPVTLALSAVISSRWAHQIAYHGAELKSFAVPAAVFAILWTLFALLPLLAFAPTLLKLRARAIPAYAFLVGEQGRLVYRRWIQRETVEDAPLLEAPEIGPVTDANSMYEAVKQMGIAPIGKATLGAVLVPIALPMIAVVAIQIPLKKLLLDLVKAVL